MNEEYDFEIDLPTKSEPNMLVDYADSKRRCLYLK